VWPTYYTPVIFLPPCVEGRGEGKSEQAHTHQRLLNEQQQQGKKKKKKKKKGEAAG